MVCGLKVPAPFTDGPPQHPESGPLKAICHPHLIRLSQRPGPQGTLSEEEQACRPHSGLGVGGRPGTGKPQDHNLRYAPPVGRVSGLTKAAETSFRRARGAANHYSNEGLAGLARSSRILTSGAGSGPSSRLWKLVAQGQSGVITIATRTSRGAELCTACSETSGLHWSTQAHHDNQGADDQAGPVGGAWSFGMESGWG